MGLYDIVMGDGQQGARGQLLLSLLGNPPVARYRDAWAEKGDDGEPVIAIYTRQGGGNRECYCGDYGRDHEAASPLECYARCNETLAAHPLYLRDADDGFDCTYATFYFRPPDAESADLLRGIAGEHVDMDERWKAAIERVRAGEMRPAETALADQLGAFLSDPSPDSPKVMEAALRQRQLGPGHRAWTAGNG